MRHFLLLGLTVFLCTLSLSAQEPDHPDKVYKMGLQLHYQYSPLNPYGWQVGMIVERCAKLSLQTGINIQNWQPGLMLDFYHLTPDSIADSYLREYIGQEQVEQLYYLGIPLQITYYPRKGIKLHAGASLDLVLAYRYQFAAQNGDQFGLFRFGQSIFKEPNISLTSGFECRLRPGLWLGVQYRTALMPLRLKDTPANATYQYEWLGPGKRRRHIQIGLTWFWGRVAA